VDGVRSFVKTRLREASRTLERERYCSHEIFELERARIFARHWMCVGRAEHVAEAGAYILADVSGESLIVVRGRDGVVRAFHNVCRHRGTRLCLERAGRFGGAIQCPYHAWSYGLDGALLAARNMDDAPGFELAEYPLAQTRVTVWEGFVFVSLAAEPEPFALALAALDRRFEPWNLGALRSGHTIAYELACNWKLVHQNYSECYHCPVIHPQLEALSASDSGRNDLVEGPVLGGYSTLRDRATSLTTTGGTARPPVGTVSGDDRERVYYYSVFPSLLLSLHADYVMVHLVEPLAVERTRVTCAWLFEPATIAAPGFDPSDAVEFWDRTNRQDWAICERTQLGVASRAYVPGPYAQSEGLLAAFDRHYRAALLAGDSE
jgi:Rieske 2Fe-2S family protein